MKKVELHQFTNKEEELWLRSQNERNGWFLRVKQHDLPDGRKEVIRITIKKEMKRRRCRVVLNERGLMKTRNRWAPTKQWSVSHLLDGETGVGYVW